MESFTCKRKVTWRCDPLLNDDVARQIWPPNNLRKGVLDDIQVERREWNQRAAAAARRSSRRFSIFRRNGGGSFMVERNLSVYLNGRHIPQRVQDQPSPCWPLETRRWQTFHRLLVFQFQRRTDPRRSGSCWLRRSRTDVRPKAGASHRTRLPAAVGQICSAGPVAWWTLTCEIT